MVIMNRLTTAKRTAVVKALVEGCSIRATVRLTSVAKNTIVKLLVELGAACTKYQDGALRNLPCKRLQCDEIWSYVGGKDKNLSAEKKADGLGSIWTWTAIDADTKLVPSWLVGSRDTATAYEFMMDLASRLRGRVQLTTDSYRPYLTAVDGAFGIDVDYARLDKIYGRDPGVERVLQSGRVHRLQG
jgi:IS1 family transposase